MSVPPEPPSGSGYGPGPGPGWGPAYAAPPARPTNNKATASLVTGVSSLVLSWCCGLGLVGIVAVVLGVKARREIESSQGSEQGEGLALGGIITGAIATVLGLLFLVLIGVALVAGARFDVSSGYNTEL
jgi:Trk-type K+ transport system membrane component